MTTSGDTELLTPNKVVLQLAGLGRELDRAVHMLKDADWDAKEKRHKADVAESLAFRKAEGSVDLRKHTARIETDEIEMDALKAEWVVTYLKQQIKAIEMRVEIGRSLGAALRAEMSMLPYQEG